MATTSQGLDVGKMALEGFGQVMDSMEFVKRAWSNFNLATPFTPTMSVEELDKRIAELRAVEQWLSLNQNMLRNTIRGLEVQRGTLEAISTMSQSFGQMAKPADDALAQTLATFAAAAAHKAATAAPSPAATGETPAAGGFDWSPFGMPSSVFNRPWGAAGAAGSPPGAPGDAAAAPDSSTAAAPDSSAEGAPAVAPAAASQEAPTETGGGASTPPDNDGAAPASPPASDAAAPAAMNPLAWWDMLQANFRQIAQAASLDQGMFAAASKAGTGTPDSAGTTPRKRGRASAASTTGVASEPAATSGKARGGSRNGSAAGRTAGAATGDATTSSARGKQTKRRRSGGAGEAG